MTRHIYTNDPIQEAICEFRFRTPQQGWSLLPGQLFDRLKDEYPAEPGQDLPQLIPPGVVAPNPNALPLGIQIAIGGPPPGRVRLASSDGSRLLLIGQGSFSVHAGRPYPLWETFSASIERALSAFSDVHPSFDIDRIGLRYINRIEGEGTANEVERYFNMQSLRFPGINSELQSFLGRSEQLLENDPNRLVIATFASTPAAEGRSAFILDLDVVAQNLSGLSTVADAFSIVAQLRDDEKDVFEASITDAARYELFGGFEDRS
jgi:uncharacterized protein (TIGR04255 family)